MLLLIAFSAGVFMIAFTLLLANILKKAFFTVSASIVMFLFPVMIKIKLLQIIINVIELLPIKAINGSYALTQQAMYNILGKDILRCYVAPIMLLSGTFLLLPIVIRLYGR
jgi:hypothetical protein